jgi:GrpB-like predicted nucleotidyltransferase (UPF0157 family)
VQCRIAADAVPEGPWPYHRAVDAQHPVELSPYSPLWPAVFGVERERLASLFGGGAAIEHVGSTAVPRLGARPIIDVLVGVARLQVAEGRIAALEADGYRYVKEFEVAFPDRRYFVRREGPPGPFHLHVVVEGSPFWQRQLAFRDALRADPALADRYWKVKQRAAARFPQDRAAYAEGKADFIRAVLQGAKVAP